MDWPMTPRQQRAGAPGHVYFIHLIIFDSERLAMSSGQTVLVNERGCETLSQRSTVGDAPV
jgi:hypothetical protein